MGKIGLMNKKQKHRLELKKKKIRESIGLTKGEARRNDEEKRVANSVLCADVWAPKG